MPAVDRVAEYEILVFLGEGAFGKVYKVKSKETGEPSQSWLRNISVAGRTALISNDILLMFFKQCFVF